MKKLILLALVALVAGAAFAETAPAFSGDFEYRTQMDFGNKEYAVDDNEGNAAINLNGVVDEWSTVDAEFAADSSGPLELNQFTLTTDVTGALGASDSPVGVTIRWGALTAQAEEYQGVAGYGDFEVAQETASYLGLELTFNIVEMINLIVTVLPSTYLGDNWTWDSNGAGPVAATDEAVMAFEVQFLGLLDGALDANVWYMVDPNRILADGGPFNQIGVSAGYTSDMVNAGLVFAGDLDNNVYGLGISANYVMDILTVGIALGMSDFSDFANNSNVNLNITFMAVPDLLDIFAGLKLPFANFSSTIAVDAGVEFFLGATSYVVGYDWRNAAFQGPELTTDGGLYFKVKASF